MQMLLPQLVLKATPHACCDSIVPNRLDPLLQVTEYVINPMALSHAELYGAAHPATGQWRHGVLAHTMRSACRDNSGEQTWMVLDGPVDARWVESMNTLLDSSRVLSLPSGERLALPPRVGPRPS